MGEISVRTSRPKPSRRYSFEWRHHGRTDVYGRRKIDVDVSFGGPQDDQPAPDRADGHRLPGRIEVTLIEGGTGADTRTTLRLSRDAAADLSEALDAALNWDGVAP